MKEEWLEYPKVKEVLKPIWKYRERYIYYNKEESTLRLKGMGSSDIHDLVLQWADGILMRLRASNILTQAEMESVQIYAGSTEFCGTVISDDD